MGYIHDKLKEALGGSKVIDSKNTVISDWTPNNIKVLVISKNFILVIYHVGGFGGSKVVKLDLEQVVKDLNRLAINGGNPQLNTILKRRSFSCLEEFYVDVDFLKTPPIIDLLGYVRELSNTTSRLRYFGYGEFPLGSDEWIRSAYQNNKRDLDYALATDTNIPFSIGFRKVGYNEWYSNYFLRPKYYRLDDENGKLAAHFRKFEEDYKNHLLAKGESKSKKVLEEGLKRIACVNDANNIIYLKKFDSLLSHLSKENEDSIKQTILGVCKKHIHESGVFEGFNTEVAKSVLSDLVDKDYLLKCYERFRILDTSNKQLDKNKILSYIKDSRGFIDLGKILDTICVESAKVLVKNGYRDLVAMALVSGEKVIPDGELRNLFIKKPSINGSIDGYYEFLEELIGIVL